MPGAGVGMASMPNAFAAGGWPPGMPAGWPPGAVGTNLRPSGPGVPMSRSTAANPAAGAAAGAAGADPNGRLNSIFPHPSSQGVGRSNNHAGKSSKKKRGRSQPPDAPLTQDSSSSSNNASQPGFLADAKAMMLCRVALGRLAVGGAGLRLPPRGHDAVTCAGGTAYPNASSNVDPIFAVFDNSQAYPEYVIHFRPQ